MDPSLPYFSNIHEQRTCLGPCPPRHPERVALPCPHSGIRMSVREDDHRDPRCSCGQGKSLRHKGTHHSPFPRRRGAARGSAGQRPAAHVYAEGCERRRPRLAAGVSGRRLAADPRRRLRGPGKSTAAAANVLAPNRFRRPVTRCSPEPGAAAGAASREMMAWSGACPSFGFEFVKRDAAPVADHPAHPAGGVARGLPTPAPNRRAPGQDGVRGCGDGSRWRLPWRLVRLERLESPSTSCAGADGTAQWTGFRRWMGGTGRETEAGTRGLEPGPLPAGGRESSGRAAGDDG